MSQPPPSGLSLASIRPLVRYVDQDLAVVDTHFRLRPSLLGTGRDRDPNPAVTVHVEIQGDRGFFDEGDTAMRVRDGGGSVRFELHAPERWWPAGMGDQSLYTVKLALLASDHQLLDEQEVTFGLNSVRRDRALGQELPPVLLVNGRICEVRDVLIVDHADAAALLPATGESLLLVRDHYGDQTLYDAADRAGILLVQSVPIDRDGTPSLAVRNQLDRLASHPCLAGYFVGHLGPLSERVEHALRELDPTRAVFRRFPLDEAA
ncbi:MAG: hypothetical protein AAGE65_02735 [Planctomycetota bacterium]